MLKYNDSAKHIHRPVPVPHYDIFGMEEWLEAMSKEGKHLSSDGFLFGFADFELGRAQSIKYRLQAARTPRKLLDDDSPDESEQELSEAMGWEYVARRGEFHIYRSTEPDAPEMNTDPAVQAMTLKAVSKRLPNHLFGMVFWCIVYPIVFFKEGIVRAAIATGSAFAIFSLIMLVWLIIGDLRAIVHIRKIRKSLEAGIRPKAKNFSRHHIPERCAFLLAVIVWLALLVAIFVRVGNAEMPLADFEGEPPFATVADFFPEDAEVERTSFMGLYDNYEYLSDPLIAPESIIWREMADVTLSDGSRLDVSMIIHYHEMKNELLAKIVAWEFLRSARSDKTFGTVPLPDLGADYSIAYADHGNYVIIRQGNRVLQATLLPYSLKDPISLEHWAQVLADSIKE